MEGPRQEDHIAESRSNKDAASAEKSDKIGFLKLDSIRGTRESSSDALEYASSNLNLNDSEPIFNNGSDKSGVQKDNGEKKCLHFTKSYIAEANNTITSSFSYLPDDIDVNTGNCDDWESNKYDDVTRTGRHVDSSRASAFINESFNFLPQGDDDYEPCTIANSNNKLGNGDCENKETLDSPAQPENLPLNDDHITIQSGLDSETYPLQPHDSILRNSELRADIRKSSRNSRQAILSVEGDLLNRSLDEILPARYSKDVSDASNDLPDIFENIDHITNDVEALSANDNKCQDGSSYELSQPKSIESSPAIQRLRSRSRSKSPAPSEGSDDEEDDEDDEYYAESFRYSAYIYVGDTDKDVDLSTSSSSPNLHALAKKSKSSSRSPRRRRKSGQSPSPKHTRKLVLSPYSERLSGASQDLSSGSASDLSSQLSSPSDTLERRQRSSSQTPSPSPRDRQSLTDRQTSCPAGSLDRQESSPSQPSSPGVFLEREVSSSPERREDSGDGKANHGRSASTSTTVSESEFRTRYQAKSTKKVIRSDSTITYKRMSHRFYEVERMVQVLKSDKANGFGFHVRGNAPIIISTVEKDTPAENGGLRVGDVLLQANGVDVSEKTISELKEIITPDTDNILLGVASDEAALEKLSPGSTIMQGYLVKQGGILKNWKRRWFSLESDNCLYYYKTQNDTEPLGAILLYMYTLTKASDVRPHCFKLSKYGARTYYLQAKDDAEMSQWAEKISEITDTNNKGTSWLTVSSHNVTLSACLIKDPCCHGYLTKMGNRHKTWKRRYCVLKDACMYYYQEQDSTTAQGVAHFHGYTVEEGMPYRKKFGFTLKPPEEKMRTFYFYADSEVNASRWIVALRRSIGHWVKVDR